MRIASTSLVLALFFASGCSCATELHPTTDSGAGNDAVSPSDDAATIVDGSTTGDAWSCDEPTPGSTMSNETCASHSSGFVTQIAILLQPGGGARMRVTGTRPGGHTSCDRVDAIDVLHGGTMIATLPANGVAVSGLSDGLTAWAEGPVDPALANLCNASGETDRFSGYSWIMHTRTNGGTITTTCGGDDTFPPAVVMTCHQGIDPAIPDAILNHMVGFGHTSLHATFRDVGTVAATDMHVHVLRAADPITTTLAPVDTTGWTFFGWMAQAPIAGAPAERVLMLDVTGSPLGTDCPMSPVTPTDHAPAFIARVTGTTSAGAFATDLYAPGCYSTP